MKRDVEYSVKAIVNTGAYESVTFSYGETLHIESTDNVKMERELLIKRVQAVINLDVRELRATLRKQKREKDDAEN